MTDSVRAASPIDKIANEYVDRIAQLDPIEATSMGVAGYDHLMTDYSPRGAAQRASAAREVLRKLDAAENAAAPGTLDEIDAVTLAAMRERIGLELRLYAAGEHERDLNNLASPLQMRDVFDLMPTETSEDWDVIAQRLHSVPIAMAGYLEQLRIGAANGKAPALRQVEVGIEQAKELASPQSFFVDFAAQAELGAISDDVKQQVQLGARAARDAYGRAAEVLREIVPHAPVADAVGRERYEMWSQYFLGARVDLEETYEWGWDELNRIIDQQKQLAGEISGPGASIEQAVAQLDADPERQLHGTTQLQEWMQQLSDRAVRELGAEHFDIPEPVRTLECRIAPTQNGGIYYTPPSEDFSRPGRMWWSVPPSVEVFNTWRETTTVYHEGVPGHHLQLGQTIYRRELLNRWRRLACWVSGHGEGWALYAEKLMDELGYLEDPGDRMGMLDAQRFRAVRVVLDIGVHLQKPLPAEWGGGTWDAAKAWELLRANANMPEDFLRFELDRYLGWPGQAPSYKVGERLWLEMRRAAEEQAAVNGVEFDQKRFHRRALDIGSVGLDVLRAALSRKGAVQRTFPDAYAGS